MSSSYHAINTLGLDYKKSQLMLRWETITVYSETHINTELHYETKGRIFLC